MSTTTHRITAAEAEEIREAYGAESTEDLLDRAIDYARDQAGTYHLPATWEAELNPDGSITVTEHYN